MRTLTALVVTLLVAVVAAAPAWADTTTTTTTTDTVTTTATTTDTVTTTTDSTVTVGQPPPDVLMPSLAGFRALDTQFTHFSGRVTCPTDAQTSVACPVKLALSWRLMNLRTGRPSGTMRALAATTTTLAPGETRTLTITVPARELRDHTVAARAGAIVYATLTDLRTGAEADQAQAWGSAGGFADCPGPAYVAFRGGTVETIDRDASGKLTRSPVLSGEIGQGEEMQAGGSPVRFTVLGVHYVVSAHAIFDRTCWGLTDYHHGQAAPTVVLDAGTVHVSGRPHGAQIWVGVGTPEGNLGSRSQERVDFTVTRNPKAQVSVMRVKVGSTTQVTPFNTPTRSPCTNGQSLAVDRHGHISRV